jgi:hypothetical protein
MPLVSSLLTVLDALVVGYVLVFFAVNLLFV